MKKKKMTTKRRKELDRIRHLIRRAEKRGYTFSEELKTSLTTRHTRSLQSLTPEKLYKQATFKIGSRQVTGLEGRAIERKRSYLKGQLRRKYGEISRTIEGELLSQALQDSMGAVFPLPDSQEFYEGELIYNNIMDIIESYPSSEGAKYLSNLLKSEIGTYGMGRVLAGLASVDEDLVRQAQEIIYYEKNSTQIHAALRDFSLALRGAMLTKEESKELNETLEVMGNYEG